jgi:beta-fructofuranosidase
MSDHLFPRYHVRPPTGYLNDPNGPILVGGLAHLYFQYRWEVDQSSPVLWGHVTSPDLARWDYHEPAIAPHPLLSDRNGCWSGNTVMDAGAVRAFYSGHVDGARPQKTLTATSPDGGYSFAPPRQVVPDPPAGEEIQELRDPFVWREGSSWRMALGAGTVGGIAMIRLYTSDDLDTWEYRGPLASMARTRTAGWDSGVMWECPQVMRVGDALVAVIGSWSPQEGVMNVLSFTTPRAEMGPDLKPSALHLVDHGPNFYAASVLANSVDGRIMWGWATEGRSPDWCQADNWSGMLSLPRVISLRPDGSLASFPLPALSSLRVDRPGVHVVDHLDGVSAQFEFLLERPESSAGRLIVRLVFGDVEYLEISVDAVGVAIDRDRASSDPRAHKGVVVVPDPDGSGHRAGFAGSAIRGFVDGSILELFLPGGKVATTRFYPTSPPPWRVELIGETGAARLRVWELSSAAPAGRP